jgi:hypothetical protein
MPMRLPDRIAYAMQDPAQASYAGGLFFCGQLPGAFERGLNRDATGLGSGC